jgi:hypothetical protein
MVLNGFFENSLKFHLADNVNIWDEPEKDIKPSMKESTGVQGFTLNDLVIALNSESDYGIEKLSNFL